MPSYLLLLILIQFQLPASQSSTTLGIHLTRTWHLHDLHPFLMERVIPLLAALQAGTGTTEQE